MKWNLAWIPKDDTWCRRRICWGMKWMNLRYDTFHIYRLFVCSKSLTGVCLCKGPAVPRHVRCPHFTGCRESSQTRAREGRAWEGRASWTFKKGGAQTSHTHWSCSPAPCWGAEKAKPTKPSFGLHQKEE